MQYVFFLYEAGVVCIQIVKAAYTVCTISSATCDQDFGADGYL